MSLAIVTDNIKQVDMYELFKKARTVGKIVSFRVSQDILVDLSRKYWKIDQDTDDDDDMFDQYGRQLSLKYHMDEARNIMVGNMTMIFNKPLVVVNEPNVAEAVMENGNIIRYTDV